MIRFFCEYIKYKLNSKQRHGIHSPFVYDFSDKCLNLPVPKEVYQEFTELKKNFLNNTSEITVEDLGAGSKKLSSNRSIKKIAKVSGTSSKYAKLLYRTAAFYKVENVLELGTSLGLGTYMMAAANENIKVTTVEGCKNTFTTAKKHFPLSQYKKVEFVNQSFANFLKMADINKPYDLVFIDGDHKGKSLFEQINLLKPLIHDETILILDDIRWSKDMYDAWCELVKNTQFNLSIDLFRLGILMKRKYQQKEHFIIRY